jgi:hypothetical protein
MAALADFSHAPRTFQSSAWSRALGLRGDGTSAACLSDLFLAMSDAMVSTPRR